MSISFATPRTVTCQAPLSMGFPRQGYWDSLPFPLPGDLPNPENKPTSLASPALAGGFFTTEPPGSPEENNIHLSVCFLKKPSISFFYKNYFSARSQKQVWNFLQIGWSTNTHTTTTTPKKPLQLCSKTQVSSSASFQV